MPVNDGWTWNGWITIAGQPIDRYELALAAAIALLCTLLLALARSF